MVRLVRITLPAALSSVLVATLNLAGCAGPSTTAVSSSSKALYETDKTLSALEQVDLAERDYVAGRYLSAAQRYQELAGSTADPTLVGNYRLRAADAFTRGGLIDDAIQELDRLNAESLSKQQYAQLQLIRAEHALLRDQPQTALAILSKTPSDVNDTLKFRLGTVHAEAYYQKGWVEESIRTLIRIDSAVNDEEVRTATHRRIWTMLWELPERQLMVPPPELSDEEAGWWSLARIVRTHPDPGSPQRRYRVHAWQETFPGHPASSDVVRTMTHEAPSGVDIVAFESARPRRIALLLPLTGPLASIGQSIRDGFQQASAESLAPMTSVRVYDTEGRADTVIELYQFAVQDNAELVVGPLQKAAIAELIARSRFEVPVLALNTIASEQSGSSKLFQFGLSPEDEARQAAVQAIEKHQYRAAVFVSQDDLGIRIGNAFVSHYTQRGGNIVEYRTFPVSSDNLSGHVKSLLKPDSERPLWRDIRDNARVSSDQMIDMIFVSGSPRDARLIRPLLRFHHAVDLPIYSTARVYAVPDPFMDRDLDGLIFCDMPAVLKTAGLKERGKATGENTPTRDVSSTRLVALGADAFLLVSQLYRMSAISVAPLEGETGRLSMDKGGRISRDLDCAVFRQGQPVALTPILHQGATRSNFRKVVE